MNAHVAVGVSVTSGVSADGWWIYRGPAGRRGSSRKGREAIRQCVEVQRALIGAESKLQTSQECRTRWACKGVPKSLWWLRADFRREQWERATW